MPESVRADTLSCPFRFSCRITSRCQQTLSRFSPVTRAHLVPRNSRDEEKRRSKKTGEKLERERRKNVTHNLT